MYSIIARRGLEPSDRTPRSVRPAAFAVVFLHGHDDSVPSSSALDAARACTIDRLIARSTWERYRDALAGDHVQSFSMSVGEFLRRRQPGHTWLVALDPDQLSLADLSALAQLQASLEKGGKERVRFIALCAREASPASLCRLFKLGAYLSKKDVSASVFVRQCQLAARGERAPLMRFSEEAGLSGAEQHAFFAECAGLSKCEAADELGCSPRTLETYWSRIFAKLRIRSTDGVVAAALRFAMLDSGAAEA